MSVVSVLELTAILAAELVLVWLLELRPKFVQELVREQVHNIPVVVLDFDKCILVLEVL